MIIQQPVFLITPFFKGSGMPRPPRYNESGVYHVINKALCCIMYYYKSHIILSLISFLSFFKSEKIQ